MIKKFFFALTALAGSLLVSAQAREYRLSWEENFDGNEINSSNWEKITRGGSNWRHYMSDEPSLYKVADGMLTLRGVVNNGLVPSDTARYLTAGLYTKGKRTLKYGKVEVRARLEAAQGAWPAIWLLPETGKWPDSGEIDILERLNHDDFVYQTVHTNYTYVQQQTDNPPHSAKAPIKTDDYNIYTVEILPEQLIFSVNGEQTFVYPRIRTDRPGQYPFGSPYYLLVDMQIEGDWVGKADPAQYPIEMNVDWVRFYDLVEK